MKTFFARLVAPAFIALPLVAAGLAPAALAADDPALVARGAYLATAADCVACHTVPGGQRFTGGRAFALPFGTLYSGNITPDRETGIGDWTDDEFVRAVHEGVGKGGEHLYPAFPYATFTAMSREDVLAIKAYLFSLPAVHAPAKPNQIAFPFNMRFGMMAWNIFYNPDKRFTPDPAKSAEWNRGNYLTNALGHCAECHTPRDILFGLQQSRSFAGTTLEGWKAYNITPDADTGLDHWSDEALASFLSTGHADGHGVASGPMAEVIDLSLRHLTPSDIHAMVTYLKSLPPQPGGVGPKVDPDPPTLVQASYGPGPLASGAPDLGRRIFEGSCASCHSWDGAGLQTPYAGLRGDRSVNDPDANNVIQVVLQGANLHTPAGLVTMPSFANAYTDTEIAAVADYVVQRFGGATARVTPADVARLRAGDQPPPWLPFVLPAIVAGLLVFVLAVILVVYRPRRTV